MLSSEAPVDEVALLVADIYEAAGVLRRWGEAIARAEGQTQARWQVLSVVCDEPLSVPRAARRLGVSRQGVQRIANNLVDDGQAAWSVNPDHRSSPLLTLTEVGRRGLDVITARASASHRQLAADIAPAEIAMTRKVLQHLVATVRQP